MTTEPEKFTVIGPIKSITDNGPGSYSFNDPPFDETKEFVRLVKMMRAAQSSYFSSKKESALRQAKDFERRVDAEIHKIQKTWEEA